MRYLWIIIVALLLTPLGTYAGSGAKMEKEAFSYELPEGWGVLTEEKEDSQFWSINFYHQNGSLIQFAVSKKLSNAAFATAKLLLRDGMGQDKSDQGWKLKKSSTIDILPFGQVDEEIFTSTKDNTTSATYTIYGRENIAIFTFTVDGHSSDIDSVVRPLLKGLAWK